MSTDDATRLCTGDPGVPVARRSKAEEAMARKAPGGVAAVNRALQILATFDGQDDPLGLSAIAARTGLYKSTILRLLESLKAFEYVAQTNDGRYHLGPAPLRLARGYQRAGRMEERIVPVLRELVEKGSESPSFHVRLGDAERLCLFRVDSRHATVDRISAGQVLPLNRGAAGKVFLALAAEPEGSDPATRRIRRVGHAISSGETDPECAAVAAPVLDQTGGLVGVLSISGPRSRFGSESVLVQLALLKQAAEKLTRAFGGRP